MFHSRQVDMVVNDLAVAIRRSLTEARVRAIYLYGSLASSGFDEHSSDIDLLVVVSKRINIADLRSLEAMHSEFARTHPDWRGRIEAQYVSTYALRHFKTRNSRIASISPGEPLHLIVAGRDWMQNWYDVQENGRTLFGPGPRVIIPSISTYEFCEAIRRYVQELLGRLSTHPGGRAYIVLTMCRALYSCETGRQISKAAAAAWTQDQLPEWSETVRQALAIRGGGGEYVVSANFAARADEFIGVAAQRVLAG